MYPIHPLADTFPLMTAEELAALVASIRANGLRQPITVWRGKVLDGRARQAACVSAGVTPAYEGRDFKDDLDAFAFVADSKLIRQHLKAEARFASWLRAAETHPALRAMLAQQKADCDRRMLAGVRQEPGSSYKAWLAPKVGVGLSTVQRILVLKRRSEPLFSQVADGKLSAGMALRRLALANRIIFRVSGKYDVLYADPPWHYDAPGIQSQGDYSDFTPDCHYKTATLDEIKGMDVESICNDNATLFLWTPASFLAKALQVVSAWGFTYKTHIVWCKSPCRYGGICLGGWVRVCHEDLLICTRGAGSPEKECLIPSHFTESSWHSAHSAKPDYVREWIEGMFPRARKLELFARKQQEGWTCWGDEVG